MRRTVAMTGFATGTMNVVPRRKCFHTILCQPGLLHPRSFANSEFFY